LENKINFTKRNLEGLPIPPSGERHVYFDAYQHNLMLRVSSNGRKVFYVRRKMNGLSERAKLGRFPELSLEQARAKAAAILSELAAGHHPRQAIRKAMAEPTIGELHELYMEGHARQRCVRLYDMQKDFDRYISDWKNLRFSQIRRGDVERRMAHVRAENGPGAANHLLVLMRAVINWNLRNENITGENPWDRIRQYKIQPRERFLHPDELVRFFNALREFRDEPIHDYVLISLYTGARRSNVLAMRWDQIDFNLAIWRIPLTKNKESHVVPLTKAAVQVLSSRERNSDWVSPGKDPANHLVEPKRAWYRLLQAAQIEDLRIHDLRSYPESRIIRSKIAAGAQNCPLCGSQLGSPAIYSA
jgi:integrase